MKSIKVNGSSIVITADAKMKDLEKLAQFCPEALIVKEKQEDGRFRDVFQVVPALCFSEDLAENGIVFGRVDADGNAQATIVVDADIVDVKKYFVSNYYKQMEYLQIAEANIKSALKTLDDRMASIEKLFDDAPVTKTTKKSN